MAESAPQTQYRGKRKPKPRPNRELNEAKKSAKTILGGKLRARKREDEQHRMRTLIEESIEEQAARERQKRTGKDRYGVQRGRRTKKYPKGRGI